MIAKILAVAWGAAVVGLLGIFMWTTPADVHPMVILVTFVFLYITVLSTLFFLMKIVFALVDRGREGKVYASVHVLYMYASVLALAPIIALAMRSVGALRPVELILIVVFEVVACFYIWRRTA